LAQLAATSTFLPAPDHLTLNLTLKPNDWAVSLPDAPHVFASDFFSPICPSMEKERETIHRSESWYLGV